MPRALALLLLLPFVQGSAAQEAGVLHVRVVLQGAGPAAMPVRRHLLLISDNPSSAPPRRILTLADGTVEVRLPPGNYTVESDQPVAFEGKAYQWIQFVDILAGRDTVLDLTVENAEVGVAAATPAASSASTGTVEDDASSLAGPWHDSVVEIWTPTTHASGFLIDATGLVVTNQHGIGTAGGVEVQLSRTLKVAGVVVAADAARDVAVVRINPATAAAIKPVPLMCTEPPPPPAARDEIVTIEAPLRRQKGTTSGTVRRVAAGVIESDLAPSVGGSGGPVFSADGVVGITSVRDDRSRRGPADARVVRVGEVCAVVELARTAASTAATPAATPLPVEPERPYPAKALEATGARGGGRPDLYQTSSPDFDIAFLTPVSAGSGRQQALGFANWSDYVADVPPVVMIRVTPKMVEGFWTKVARGAASTQGIALPPMPSLKPGFSRMRLLCGGRDVTPIHPFVLEQEVPGTGTTIIEGLYVFDPDAISPSCGDVKLALSSRKDPAKADTRVVDPKVVQRVWDDFAAYRTQP